MVEKNCKNINFFIVLYNMKKLKYLLLSLLFLTGCNMSKAVQDVTPVITNDTTDNRTIVTNESVVRATTSDSYLLQYSILPASATNKKVIVDDTYLGGIAEVTVDDRYNVFVWGKVEGTGILSLCLSNGKFVSYSITVINTEPGPGPDPTISTIDRIANHFNENAGDEMQVYYWAETKQWEGEKNFGPATDTSRQTLGSAAYFVRTFLPDYLFRYNETYGEETGRVEFFLAMVNSNISAVAEITSYVDAGNLIAKIVIGDTH